MGNLRFYYNTTAKKSERVIYYNSAILWNKPLTIKAISNDYVWEEHHNNLDIAPYVISEVLLQNVKTKTVAGIGLIIDADNAVFAIDKSHLYKHIGSFVICNNNKPIVSIDGYEDLPLRVTGTELTVNFYNGIEKIFAFNIDSFIVNNALLYQLMPIEIPRPDDVIIRNNIDLSFSDEMDKSSIHGKNGIYRDISITGKAHPLTGDLVSVIGKAAINQSLRTILLANTYDRPFRSKDIAGNLNAFLFEFNDDVTNSELKSGIAIAINNHEPRITIIDILTEGSPESYSLNVTLIYTIKTTNTTQEFSIMLDRA